MKRNFSTELKGLQNARLEDEKGVAFTLGNVAVNALLGQYQDEQVGGDEKFKRFKLADRISVGGVQEVSAEEIALIKRLVGKGFLPMFVGAVYDALEQDITAEPAAS